MPKPIVNCLKQHFKFNDERVTLMDKLGYNSLEYFIVHGALSVKDMVATVSSRYINNRELAVVLFVA